jgi:hypothetical protein
LFDEDDVDGGKGFVGESDVARFANDSVRQAEERLHDAKVNEFLENER